MEKVIIIRYAEIHLKGKNRGYFEHVFSVNLERSLRGLRHELQRMNGRYIVARFDENRTDEILSRIAGVFGVHSYSPGYRVENSFEGILEAAKTVSPRAGTFKVETHRGDKNYPMTSPEISREVGAKLLEAYPALSVDVHEPNAAVYIDIRENGYALVFGSFLKGAGGMPVSTSGKGLLLISGGIDSPVAGYMMAKRGMSVSFLHFHSYPYTSDLAKEKVVTLAKELSRFTLTERLTTVSVTHIQEEIHAKCDAIYNITLLRRFMFRIAQRIAERRGEQCLVTGESLGQVASQTIEGMQSSNEVVSLPVLRPLVGFDKEEIITRAKEIGTFETSILPYEDCCTVFLPDHPVIKPKLSDIYKEERKLDIEGLLEEALLTVETVKI